MRISDFYTFKGNLVRGEIREKTVIDVSTGSNFSKRIILYNFHTIIIRSMQTKFSHS